MKSLGTWVARGFTLLVLAIVVGWSALAIYYSNLPWPMARLVLSGAFVLGSLAVLAAVRPLRRGAIVVLSGFLIVLVWFFLIPPSNDRDWQRDVAVLAHATIDGDRVTIENVRNNAYRSETRLHAALRDADLRPEGAAERGPLSGLLGLAAHRPHRPELRLRR